MIPNEYDVSEIAFTQGFPSFSIFTPSNGTSLADPSTLIGTFNDSDYFDYGFIVSDENDINQKIDAIPCNDAIDQYGLDDSQKFLIKQNYDHSFDYFLCPDLKSFKLFTENWLSFV